MNDFAPQQETPSPQQPNFPNQSSGGGSQQSGLSTKTLISICGGIVLVGLVIIGVYQLVQKNGSDNTNEQTEHVVMPKTEVRPVSDDLDNDGVLDVKEKELGLSNRNYDTDGDGLTDKQELDTYNTDPTNTDSDGDGYADGYEVMNGFNPAGDGKLPKETK